MFPRYSPSAPAQVEQVSPLHTLRMMNEGGMVLARHFARAQFEVFLKSIFLTPAYTLHYASLEDASIIFAKLHCL